MALLWNRQPSAKILGRFTATPQRFLRLIAGQVLWALHVLSLLHASWRRVEPPRRELLVNLMRSLPAAALGSVLFLGGCGSDIFPAETDPMTTVDPVTDFGLAIQDVYGPITWWVSIIGIIVLILLVAVVVVFRDKGDGSKPEQIHGNLTMEVGWTLLPVIIVIFILVPTVRTIFMLGDAAPDDNIEVKVIGKRWWWEFRYVPDGDLVTREIVTANQMHLPVDKHASLLITSDSVIHSFWAPRLGGKRDAVPGRTNRMWFRMLPDCGAVEAGQPCTNERPKPGEPVRYQGECAEFCGESHAQMKFDVIMQTNDDFRDWAKRMLEPEKPTDEVALAGMEVFNSVGCSACHAITGNPAANGNRGPDLTNFGLRHRLAATGYDVDDELLKTWIHKPDVLKPGASVVTNKSRGTVGADDGMNVVQQMPALDTDGDGYPNFSDEQLDQLVAYLRSLK
ncbi:MAG: cytochrome c oxidase subunit II [Deltaproteobacteria bacterium]|nr:MAG: cytochrome c oxidase subunit II [Deltaproteobacteria bacterium]